MTKRTLLACIPWLCLSFHGKAQSAMPDSLHSTGGKDTWWNSLIHGNRDRSFDKKFDVSFLPAPTWSIESKIGIGGILTGLYRLDRKDSIMPPSDVSLGGNVSVTGYYSVSVFGNTYFKGNRHRLAYKLILTHKPLDFWGFTYDECAANPAGTYTRQLVKAEIDYVYKWTDKIHVGSSLLLNYQKGSGFSHANYLKGQKQAYFFTGFGLSLAYDTRDYILNPRKGIYLNLKETILPQITGNYDRTLLSTTAVFDAYCPAWKGSVFAFDLYGSFFGQDTPWTLREQAGSGTSRMRGYYEGRYTDCNQMSFQIELRQNIAKRFGMAAWGGGGWVFPSFAALRRSRLLPNYGVGIRWEFKHNMNLRVDYGWGKESHGLVFGFGEAF